MNVIVERLSWFYTHIGVGSKEKWVGNTVVNTQRTVRKILKYPVKSCIVMWELRTVGIHSVCSTIRESEVCTLIRLGPFICNEGVHRLKVTARIINTVADISSLGLMMEKSVATFSWKAPLHCLIILMLKYTHLGGMKRLLIQVKQSIFLLLVSSLRQQSPLLASKYNNWALM